MIKSRMQQASGQRDQRAAQPPEQLRMNFKVYILEFLLNQLIDINKYIALKKIKIYSPTRVASSPQQKNRKMKHAKRLEFNDNLKLTKWEDFDASTNRYYEEATRSKVSYNYECDKSYNLDSMRNSYLRSEEGESFYLSLDPLLQYEDSDLVRKSKRQLKKVVASPKTIHSPQSYCFQSELKKSNTVLKQPSYLTLETKAVQTEDNPYERILELQRLLSIEKLKSIVSVKINGLKAKSVEKIKGYKLYPKKQESKEYFQHTLTLLKENKEKEHRIEELEEELEIKNDDLNLLQLRLNEYKLKCEFINKMHIFDRINSKFKEKERFSLERISNEAVLSKESILSGKNISLNESEVSFSKDSNLSSNPKDKKEKRKTVTFYYTADEETPEGANPKKGEVCPLVGARETDDESFRSDQI